MLLKEAVATNLEKSLDHREKRRHKVTELTVCKKGQEGWVACVFCVIKLESTHSNANRAFKVSKIFKEWFYWFHSPSYFP